MDGSYNYVSRHGGSAIDLDDLQTFLRLAMEQNPEKHREFKAMVNAMNKEDCPTVGQKRNTRIRVDLKASGVVRKLSLRTVLHFILTGRADIIMPLSSCVPGCINPHHCTSTTPSIASGKLSEMLVIHSNRA